MKKTLSLLLAVILVFSLLPMSAFAVNYSGELNETIDWEFDPDTGTLTLTGTGTTPGYQGYDRPPWDDYSDEITKIVVGSGITELGRSVFAYSSNLEVVELPLTLTKVGDFAFHWACTSLTVYYEGSPEQWGKVNKLSSDPMQKATVHYYWHYATTASFDPNGGTVGTKTKTVYHDKTYGSLPTPSRAGYTFDGWYTAADGGDKVTSSTIVTATEDHTLYAHWSGKTYTVTFKGGDYKQSIPSQKVTAGQPYGELPLLTLEGKAFLGWYTAAEGGEKITSATICTISQNQTLYAHWSEGGLQNFVKKYTYNNPFTDVLPSNWFAAGVQHVYELGLVTGETPTYFNAKGNITLAGTIVLASRIHKLYTTGDETFEGGVRPWYQPYVDYAMENGICTEVFADYNAPATRRQFAVIMGHSFPEGAMEEFNNVEMGAIPDVALDDPSCEFIYHLYRAGILTGSDAYGRYLPDSYIVRSEVAVLVARMTDPGQRKTVTLTTDIGTPGVPSGINGNLTWPAVAGAMGYEIFAADSPDGPYTKLGESASNAYYAPGLSVGFHYFKVAAFKDCAAVRKIGEQGEAGKCFTYGGISWYENPNSLSDADKYVQIPDFEVLMGVPLDNKLQDVTEERYLVWAGDEYIWMSHFIIDWSYHYDCSYDHFLAYLAYIRGMDSITETTAEHLGAGKEYQTYYFRTSGGDEFYVKYYEASFDRHMVSVNPLEADPFD